MKKLGILFISLLVTFVCKADHLSDRLTFSAQLNGASVLPTSVTGNANGVAALMINNTRDTVYLSMAFTGLTGAVTSVHIHSGSSNLNGPVLFDLTSSLNGNIVTARLAGGVLANNLSKLFSGNVYVDVHTAANPNGELRGQIHLESNTGFYAQMDTSQEVQSVSGSTAVGNVIFTISQDETRMYVHAITNGLSGNIVSATLNQGSLNQNGTLVMSLDSLISGKSLDGWIYIPAALRNGALVNTLNGQVYINLTTGTNTAGEVRGQISQTTGLAFDVMGDPAQVVGSVVGSTAISCGYLSLSTDFNTLTYHIVVYNPSSASTGVHFHTSSVGANGTVVKTIALSGSIINGTWTTTDATQPLTEDIINKLLSGDIYFDVHTSSNVGGELRGQVYRHALEGLIAEINKSQIVGSAVPTNDPYGTALVSYDRDRTDLHYLASVTGLSSSIAQAHLHNNQKGANGPAIFTVPFTSDGASGYWAKSATVFNDAESIKFRRGDSVYIDIHTSNYANGEARGQFIRNYKNTGKVITSVSEPITSKRNLSIYPNPVADQLNVFLPAQESGILRVFMIDGRLVNSESFNPRNGNLKLDTEHLKSGVYLLEIESKSGVCRTKFIKG